MKLLYLLHYALFYITTSTTSTQEILTSLNNFGDLILEENIENNIRILIFKKDNKIITIYYDCVAQVIKKKDTLLENTLQIKKIKRSKIIFSKRIKYMDISYLKKKFSCYYKFTEVLILVNNWGNPLYQNFINTSSKHLSEIL